MNNIMGEKFVSKSVISFLNECLKTNEAKKKVVKWYEDLLDMTEEEYINLIFNILEASMGMEYDRVYIELGDNTYLYYMDTEMRTGWYFLRGLRNDIVVVMGTLEYYLDKDNGAYNASYEQK